MTDKGNKQNQVSQGDCTVLIISCDMYSDLWRPFFSLWWKHWPDCPFTVHLGTNTEAYPDPRVRMMLTGEERGWANRLRQCLERIDTKYVLLSLEDFFLQSRVDTSAVLHCLQAIDRLGGVMLRLIPRPGPDRRLATETMVGECSPQVEYRLSSQTAIWRRDALMEYLVGGESIWDFEIRGNERAASVPTGFYCVWRPVMTYHHHVVERGKWFRRDARRFGKMNIGCDFQRRAIMSRTEMWLWRWSKVKWLLVSTAWGRQLQRWKRRLVGGTPS